MARHCGNVSVPAQVSLFILQAAEREREHVECSQAGADSP